MSTKHQYVAVNTAEGRERKKGKEEGKGRRERKKGEEEGTGLNSSPGGWPSVSQRSG